MAGYSLTAVQSQVVEIVPMWRFEVVLPTIKDYKGDEFVPPSSVYVQKLSLPNHIIADESEQFATWAKHFPTLSNVDNVSITMLESGGDGNTVDPDGVTHPAWQCSAYWEAWQSLVHDKDGNYGLPVDYWQTITVYPLDSAGRPIRKLDMLETWPLNVNNYDFDGSVSEPLWITVQLTCHQIVSSEPTE